MSAEDFRVAICRLCRRESDNAYDVCDACGIVIARRYADRLTHERDEARRRHDEAARRADAERREREKAAQPPEVAPLGQTESVVYYVRLGEHIKIGYSVRVVDRLKSLRVWDIDQVLAIEPGGRRLEQQRHQQFDHLRLRPRWEEFRPEAELLEHIAQVRAEHEFPDWLTLKPAPRRSKYATPVTVRHKSA